MTEELDLGSALRNLVIDRGSTFQLPFTVAIGGVLQPWAGWTASFVVSEVAGGTPLVAVTQAGGITLGPTDGVGEIELSSTQINALPPSVALYYRFQLTSGAGIVYPMLHGRFTVRVT